MSTEVKNNEVGKVDSKEIAVTSTSTSDEKSNVSETPDTSKPAVDIPVISTCIAEGCNNIPISHPEWDHEYCSIKCCYNHCKSTFQGWLEANKLLKTHNAASSTRNNLPTQLKDAKVKKA